MIDRYSHKKLKDIWTEQRRFKLFLDVELAYLQVLIEEKEIPDITKSLKKIKLNIDRIKELEKETKHETVAFINSILEQDKTLEYYFHKGLTSSDVLDTVFSIQLRDAGLVILDELSNLIMFVKNLAIKYKRLPSISRTHGIYAEPSSFGLKFLRFYTELKRAYYDFNINVDFVSICMLSGAVGTYSLIKPEYEKKVAERLNLRVLELTSQIIPRDIYARYFSSLSILAGVIERFAVELRLLQRSEVAELGENFTNKQTGSSVMPHKKNPISLENITGIARYIRNTFTVSLENILLWEERDISHSSTERIFAPDLTILTGYMLKRLSGILKNLEVDDKKVLANLNKAGAGIFSSYVLKYLIDNGIERQKAYKIVQNLSFKNLELKDYKNELEKLLKGSIEIELDSLFKYENYLKNIDTIYDRVLG